MKPLRARLFAYGTLKRGSWNHDAYCRGYTNVVAARVQGDLYELPIGFPAAVVPRNSILAWGTFYPAADAFAEARAGMGRPPSLSTSQTGWIHGDLMTFEDAGSRIPKIDALEGYRQDNVSGYRRVLVWAYPERGKPVPAWIYAWPEHPRRGRHIPEGLWVPGKPPEEVKRSADPPRGDEDGR